MFSIPPTPTTSQVASSVVFPYQPTSTSDDTVQPTIPPAHTSNQSASPLGSRPLGEPTIEALVSGRAWNAIAPDHQIRFLVGVAQMFGTGAGYIITQPCERIHWQVLIQSGYITLDEHDSYVLHLTDLGSILFYTVLGQYIPIEERH